MFVYNVFCPTGSYFVIVEAVGRAWKMVFTNAEKADMLIIYGECRKNAVRSCTVYAETYPNRRQPSRQLFVNLFKQLRESGSITCRKRNRNKRSTGEEGEINVLAAVAVDPQISSRAIARGSGISQRSVIRILHRHKFHPYHISLHQGAEWK